MVGTATAKSIAIAVVSSIQKPNFKKIQNGRFRLGHFVHTKQPSLAKVQFLNGRDLNQPFPTIWNPNAFGFQAPTVLFHSI